VLVFSVTFTAGLLKALLSWIRFGERPGLKQPVHQGPANSASGSSRTHPPAPASGNGFPRGAQQACQRAGGVTAWHGAELLDPITHQGPSITSAPCKALEIGRRQNRDGWRSLFDPLGQMATGRFPQARVAHVPACCRSERRGMGSASPGHPAPNPRMNRNPNVAEHRDAQPAQRRQRWPRRRAHQVSSVRGLMGNAA